MLDKLRLPLSNNSAIRLFESERVEISDAGIAKLVSSDPAMMMTSYPKQYKVQCCSDTGINYLNIIHEI